MNLTQILITRWALTEGVLVWEPQEPDDVKVCEDGSLEIVRYRSHFAGGHGEFTESYSPAFVAAGEWARTEEEAAAQVRAMAAAKASRIEKRVARLRRLAGSVELIKTKPAKKSANWRAWGIDE